MSKRTNGDGEEPRQLPSGIWSARVSYTDLSGKRRQVRVSADTKRACAAKVRDKIREVESGATPTAYTVSSYLDAWCKDTLPALEIAPRSKLSYQQRIPYAKKYLGKVRLVDLTPAHIESMLSRMTAEGYAANTRRLTRQLMTRVLNTAVRDGLVVRNVASLAAGPKNVASKKGRALTVEERQMILAELAGTCWEERVRLHIATGMRPGELLGITYEDIDLERRIIQVTGQSEAGVRVDRLKTHQSRRPVPVPESAVPAIKAAMLRTKHDFLRSNNWVGPPPGHPQSTLFRGQGGKVVRVDTYTKRMRSLTEKPENAGTALRKAGPLHGKIDHFTPHDFRHTWATDLIERGIPPQYVADVMGDSVTTVLKTYRHAMRIKHEAADEIDRIFREIDKSEDRRRLGGT